MYDCVAVPLDDGSTFLVNWQDLETIDEQSDKIKDDTGDE